LRLIPAIDLIDGRCVRLREGRFDARTDYEADPVELALDYARAGACWLHVVDLDGARDGDRRNADLIRRLVARVAQESGAQVQLGGGVRDAAAVESALALGARRAVVGSTGILDPNEFVSWLDRFGPAALVLAVDVRLDEDGTPWPWTHGWTRRAEIDLWALLGRVANAGLRHLLCTDIGRDGTLAGPNVELYEMIRDRHPGLTIQSSGGVSGAHDLDALAEAGLDAAITGKALLDGRLTLEEARPWLGN
jgi:phosphoribosylformimino-5-aminoimidazole carboxamide ribotide isomerase